MYSVTVLRKVAPAVLPRSVTPWHPMLVLLHFAATGLMALGVGAIYWRTGTDTGGIQVGGGQRAAGKRRRVSLSLRHRCAAVFSAGSSSSTTHRLPT